MSDTSQSTIREKDRAILRGLASRIAEIAADPIMEERKSLWNKMNSLRGERPMILTEAMGIGDEAMPFNKLECEGDWAKNLERTMREKIFHFEEIGDDFIVHPFISWNNAISATDYGVQSVTHRTDNEGKMASYSWDAAVGNLSEDLHKLKHRTFQHDKEMTEAGKSELESVFGDIMPLRHVASYWWTQGLTITAVNLIGLEELMLKMYDEPEGLHALMAFLRDDHMQQLDWYEANGVLSPTVECDSVGSGGCGYTDQLPQADYDPTKGARIRDLWGLSESQETVGVSPDLFAEFIFPYQLPIISRFGLACYGCCEPVDQRWSYIKQIPKLRRVSVSPWSNVENMAENLGQNYVYSRKPNPSHISTEKLDEELIREELRKVIVATKGMNVELVMKDVHTINNEPVRLGRWTQIAREEIDKVYGS